MMRLKSAGGPVPRICKRNALAGEAVWILQLRFMAVFMI